MDPKLWKFIADDGSFSSDAVPTVKSLYFPVCNELVMSSLTPDLHGDLKSGQNTFLLAPVSRIDIADSRSSRNFWIYKNKDEVWSAAGVSKNAAGQQSDRPCFSGGLLWQEVTRENAALGVKADILSFVPSSGEPVEVMRVRLTNISGRRVEFVPTAAIPIYARSAHNIRDHRHVTSLLQRIKIDAYGVIVKPTLFFDETGHKPNETVYFVVGMEDGGKGPESIFPTQEMFCGDSGDLEMPQSVMDNREPASEGIQGKEAMGGLRFGLCALEPGQSRSYIILMGISGDARAVGRCVKAFNSIDKVDAALAATQAHWRAISDQVALDTGDKDIDNWFRWVSIQPTLRRIFGCSFLPDFDYGKGGRGWRDLWQDCLGLLLSSPDAVRGLLINNFGGVKIDGSNATIIGARPGEFIADRNSISRVWMDHGIWPLLTLDLYMHETGDLGILFEEMTYFHDHQVCRSRDYIKNWDGAYGNKLRTSAGTIYKGSILEHLLLQALVQFYNVGRHNHIRLEGADWNDGLDMAGDKGESVAFSAMYAHNLRLLAHIIRRSGKRAVKVAAEMKLFLKKLDYNDIRAKQNLLDQYFGKVRLRVAGTKAALECGALARDLEDKAEWMMGHIRAKEWLKEGFFNGYYDNDARRVEGRGKNGIRMMLASQVFPVMSGTAREWQVKEIIRSTARYLKDTRLGGYHLNTDFGEEQHSLGRAFSFVYGDKENGAYFNHMIVMYAYGLYQRGFGEDGWEVLHSIMRMALDTGGSKIFPCLPEYFDLQGRGMYSYLTGSASWFVLTMMTQAFGIKGNDGDLRIEPKLSSRQFADAATIAVRRVFAGRKLKVFFSNDQRLPSGAYTIIKATLNGAELPAQKSSSITISRQAISKLPANKTHELHIFLG